MHLTKIGVRTYTDLLPKEQVDGVYLFGQTIGNQESVLDMAAVFMKNRIASKILFFQSDALSGYPGHKPWLKYLRSKKVAEKYIELIDPGDIKMIHTRIEAEALIDHCMQRNYKEIIVTSSPFHQLRSFITVISVVLERNAKIKVYSQQGFYQDWDEKVNHSQGTLSGTRNSLLEAELERIKIYQEKGDLDSFENIWNYLISRDK